ncbi:MAG TPA: TonB family protein, partial [Vicinamibacterales bacterium]|nr:TonB family protein [Vicinamibacterales bacterium]
PGDDHPPTMQLVFLATPGPGGGGGGGGLEQPAPPPKAELEGRPKISSPIPATPPVAIAPPLRPVLKAEPLPTIVAPIMTVPADNRTRIGVAEEARAENESSGPGKGGGVGSGTGVGVGPGDGSGVGPGSGGGFGGGPYRPGSGVNPPRLLREVKADYTEDARRRGLAGEVVLEIVVRSDGSVGDVKILQGLGSGLDQRAVEAVRQWRFAPAERQGAPVDVYVEVAVEFKLR